MKKMLIMLGMLAFVRASHAKLIAYEPFSYPGGNGESLVGVDAGLGWDGGWEVGSPAAYTGTGTPIFTLHSAYTNGFPEFYFNYADTNGVAIPTRGHAYAKFRFSNPSESMQGAWGGFYAQRAFAETNAVPVNSSIWFSLIAAQGSYNGTFSSRVLVGLQAAGVAWDIIKLVPKPVSH